MRPISSAIQSLLPAEKQLVSGPAFPYKTFTCIPLASSAASEKKPLGFVLRRGTETTLIQPGEGTVHTALWDDLLDEMTHWHAAPSGKQEDLPPECWYG